MFERLDSTTKKEAHEFDKIALELLKIRGEGLVIVPQVKLSLGPQRLLQFCKSPERYFYFKFLPKLRVADLDRVCPSRTLLTNNLYTEIFPASLESNAVSCSLQSLSLFYLEDGSAASYRCRAIQALQEESALQNDGDLECILAATLLLLQYSVFIPVLTPFSRF